MPSTQDGTRGRPWILKTPSGQSEFQAFRDAALNPPVLVIQAGTTELRYHLGSIEDLYAMLKARGDWVPLGSADEQKPAPPGTVRSGVARPGTPWGVGTASARGSVDGSGCTYRPSWRSSGWRR
jgi:hypothetical protein